MSISSPLQGFLRLYLYSCCVCSFATDVVNIYYDSDETVCEDLELQAFVKDVYVYGMRGNKASGETFLSEPDSLTSLHVNGLKLLSYLFFLELSKKLLVGDADSGCYSSVIFA